MKLEAPDNSLGIYLTRKLKNRNLDSTDIHTATDIPIGSIRKMRNGDTKAIPAGELYLFSLFTGDKIEEVLKEVFPTLKLVNSDKPISRNIKEKTSLVGEIIFSLEDYNLDILAHRTGLERDRLRRLTKLDRSKIEAHELYLIEMAAEREPGSLFFSVFKDLKLNTKVEQKRLQNAGESGNDNGA